MTGCIWRWSNIHILLRALAKSYSFPGHNISSSSEIDTTYTPNVESTAVGYNFSTLKLSWETIRCKMFDQKFITRIWIHIRSITKMANFQEIPNAPVSRWGVGAAFKKCAMSSLYRSSRDTGDPSGCEKPNSNLGGTLQTENIAIKF